MSEGAVRRLTAADAAIYRDIRLEALTRHPELFGSSLAREEAWDEAAFARRLDAEWRKFGGFRDGALEAVAGWHPKTLDNGETVAALNAVYSRPCARGSGLIDAVIAAIQSDAAGQATRLRAAVAAYNTGGRRLFERLGFVADEQTWIAGKMGLRLFGDPGAVTVVDYFKPL
jgi:GNAT superfamily N-acetyltransferase